jgi:hypothetical protein
VEGSGPYGNSDLYLVNAERNDNCISNEFGGVSYWIAPTVIDGEVPHGGPINVSTYCENGTIWTRPIVAYGDDWIVEEMPTQGVSSSAQVREAFMRGLADAAGGSIWIGSCPDNASIEQDHLEAAGSG